MPVRIFFFSSHFNNYNNIWKKKKKKALVLWNLSHKTAYSCFEDNVVNKKQYKESWNKNPPLKIWAVH